MSCGKTCSWCLNLQLELGRKRWRKYYNIKLFIQFLQDLFIFPNYFFSCMCDHHFQTTKSFKHSYLNFIICFARCSPMPMWWCLATRYMTSPIIINDCWLEFARRMFSFSKSGDSRLWMLALISIHYKYSRVLQNIRS